MGGEGERKLDLHKLEYVRTINRIGMALRLVMFMCCLVMNKSFQLFNHNHQIFKANIMHKRRFLRNVANDEDILMLRNILSNVSSSSNAQQALHAMSSNIDWMLSKNITK